MTDSEIKKALECCKGKGCKDCPFNVNCATCISKLIGDALDLINRLEAERDGLKRHGGKKCGTCIYAKPTTFGRSKVYVECTNEEHLKRYCSYHESAKNRLRTTPACKKYEENPDAEREDNRNETS